MKPIRRFPIMLLAASLALSSGAQAVPSTLIDTYSVAAAGPSEARARLHALVQRDDLAAALRERGVPAAAVQARIDALTDAEATGLLARIDAAPAGGTEVLGLLFTVFIILLAGRHAPRSGPHLIPVSPYPSPAWIFIGPSLKSQPCFSFGSLILLLLRFPVNDDL